MVAQPAVGAPMSAPVRWGRARPSGILLVLVAGALGLAAPALGAALPSATPHPTLTATVSGPSTVGTGTTNSYLLTATGGPAFGFNGTQVGVLSFSTSVIGLNTSAVQLLPTAGVFTNGAANLTLGAGNLTQTLTLSIEVKSGYGGQNVTTNVTYVVNVVLPYELQATVVVDSSQGTMPFSITVLLDGAPVGTVAVPSLTGHASYQLTFRYVNPGLAVGWHTFTLNLAEAHGLLLFAGGSTVYAQSFYVAGPAPNDTLWYTTGAVAFVGAIFIWLTAVGARRRGRKR
jgi:hypothetical protein